jgi:hypothetical protein
MHKNATKCNKILRKWCKNKHGASKIIDAFETYHTVIPVSSPESRECPSNDLDDTYIELDDDFIAEVHATRDVMLLKNF